MTVSKIQMAQPALVKRNPRNRSILNIGDTQRAMQTQPDLASTRRCLFGKAPEGENNKIAQEELKKFEKDGYERIKNRFGYDIKTGRPVEEDPKETNAVASERLQESDGDPSAEALGDNLKSECPRSEEGKDTVKAQGMCNGASARKTRKEISSTEKSRRVKPYGRPTKQTQITDHFKAERKTARSRKSSIESKEKR
ncbi:uncharacterized protein LOC129787704 [Lutzomyia longipalpis]|uniref:Uncharacterized protein n=1 Tax=Lutzomyia longipalpis TaxID=7200 RepID=A0A7G3AK88_LUTLO|nr:uncharacterized protein LOC129787704 [Lutzomyia longipalpis]